ncbi:MAG: glycoside hydrolase family 2 protein [Candidatus Helarchaeota archaeon]
MLILNGTWKAKTDNDNIGEAEGYYEVDFNETDWKAIKVPGHWQEEGFPNYQGILWYRFTFEIPDEMKKFHKIIRLQFQGVFYYCKVWLNGEFLDDHEGYFDRFDFDVTSLLDKENLLCVKVVCDEEKNSSSKRQITGVYSHWDSSDPLFNPGGIWGDVALIETGLTYIKYIELKSEIVDQNTARLFFRCEMVTKQPSEKKFHLSISPKNFHSEEFNEEFYEKLEKEETEFEREILIEDAHYWWTHDQGYPFLYTFTLKVFEHEQLSDVYEHVFGLREFTRKIEGRSWEFYLNNKRIYIRGGNYAPSNHRIAYVTRDDIARDIDLAVEANFNMIRVHAHLDRTELHEVCAERGILIWQDFPLQWGYSMKIKETAKDQAKLMVQKLQNYPSQGIYCCHNEPFTGLSIFPIILMGICLLGSYGLAWLVKTYIGFFQNAIFWGVFTLLTLFLGLLPTSVFIYNRNKDVLDKELVKAIQAVDNSLPIVQNSGVMGIFRKGTDLHTYEGWYFAKNYRDAYCYTKFPLRRMVPFVTEYGAQSFPSLENYKKIVKGDDPWPINWALLKEKHRCQPMFFARWFDIDSYHNISDFIEATQEYQAELLKFYNELWRIHRYNPNGGAIMFQFNDCFPGITWSIVDYWRSPKRAYYATQLSFEPVYVMADWPKKYYKPGSIFKTKLYVVNDLHEVITNVKIHWELQDNQKIVLSAGDYLCTLDEDSIQTLATLEHKLPQNATEHYLLILTLEFDETIIQNTYRIKIRGGSRSG